MFWALIEPVRPISAARKRERKCMVQSYRAVVGKDLATEEGTINRVTFEKGRWAMADGLSMKKEDLVRRRSFLLLRIPPHPSFTQFSKIVPPKGVITLSGWNCKPQTLKRVWRSAMITPCSLRAVISNSVGKVAGSAAQLW